jgi:AcrR family transcriptional regulator
MTKRAAAMDETRRRIVDATVSAHRELGIQPTSWDEIARRAGVGVGTVYRHFRSLDDLLPACGSVVTDTLALPTGERVRHLFDGVVSLRARIERLVTEVFAVYERGAPYIYNIRRERSELPQLESWHQLIEDTLDALDDEAVRPHEVDEAALRVVRTVIDISVWTAFKEHGFSGTEANETVTGLITDFLRTRTRPPN